MTPLTTAKLALGMAGVLLFGYGIRTDAAPIRWAGVALLGIAFLLRFIGPQKRR